MPNCPRCRRPLHDVDTPAGAVPGCTECAHVWLDAAKLAELQNSAERRYRKHDVAALRIENKQRNGAALQREIVYFKCPACENQMLRRTFGETSFLLVHFCAAHGYWIDLDELDGIASFIERGGEMVELGHVVERLEERIRELETDNRGLQTRIDRTPSLHYS